MYRSQETDRNKNMFAKTNIGSRPFCSEAKISLNEIGSIRSENAYMSNTTNGPIAPAI